MDPQSTRVSCVYGQENYLIQNALKLVYKRLNKSRKPNTRCVKENRLTPRPKTPSSRRSRLSSSPKMSLSLAITRLWAPTLRRENYLSPSLPVKKVMISTPDQRFSLCLNPAFDVSLQTPSSARLPSGHGRGDAL